MAKTPAQRRALNDDSQMMQAFREEFGMSQTCLAALFNVTRSYVGAMETGKRDLGSQYLLKMHQYREEIEARLALAEKTGALVKKSSDANAHHKDLCKIWSRKLKDVKHKIKTIEIYRESKLPKDEYKMRAHKRLKDIVPHVEENILGSVLKVSHRKIAKHAKQIPIKQIDDDLKLECLHAEAEIIKKYLLKYSGGSEEDNGDVPAAPL